MKFCIVNAAWGDGYVNIQNRLVQSLRFYGYDGEILTWQNCFPNDNYAKEGDGYIYNLKAAAIEEAINKGFDSILWLDASFFAVHNIQPIIDHIEKYGYYFINNGYRASEECSDKCLEYFRLTRDEAEKIPMISSGIMGLNLKNYIGHNLATQFIKSAKDGVFLGSRRHNNQSADPRFLHHRQDQSAMSCIIGTFHPEVKIYNIGHEVVYNDLNNPQDKPDGCIFKIQGV